MLAWSLIALTVITCGGQSNNSNQPSASPTARMPNTVTPPTVTVVVKPSSTTQQPLLPHPTSTYTGIEGVDSFLRAIYDGSSDEIAVVMTPIECGSEGPPCPPDVAAGTPIGAILVSGCESGYLTSSEAVREQLSRILQQEPQLLAVYGPTTISGVSAAFAVVLSQPIPTSPVIASTAYLDSSGSLIAFTNCTLTWPPAFGEQVLFPPP
jgi:hypothetical protein